MEWKFIFRNDDILEIKAEGIFTFTDFKAMVQEMISEKKWKQGLHRLFDGRKLDVKHLDINTMFNIGKIQQDFRKEIGGGRLAILTKNTSDYGTGISYKEIVHEKLESEVNILLNYDKAIEWLKKPMR